VAPRNNKKRNKQVKKNARVTLEDLAHFAIKSITPMANQSVELTGVFSHFRGVRLPKDRDGTVGFLYVSRKDSVYLLRKTFNRTSRNATFIAWPSPKKPLNKGSSYPYIDYYWSPKQASFALEPDTNWRRTLFRAEDSVRYRDPKVPGWWTSHVASAPVSKGAADVQIIKDGWDHEHCNFCRAEIGRHGDPYGYYSKSDNDWLCVSCYKKFVARHDLRFLQFET